MATDAERPYNCMSLLANQVQQLSLSCMPSDRVEIKISELPNAGRGLIVTEDVAAGEELFRSEPIVSIVPKKQRHRLCDWCHSGAEAHHPADDSNIDIKICKECGDVGYCSVWCQKAAWENYHGLECEMLQSMHHESLPLMAANWRAVCRLLCMDILGTLPRPMLRALKTLKVDVDTVSQQDQALEDMVCTEYAQRLTKSSLSVDTIRHLYQAVCLNSACFYSPEGDYLCTGVDTTFSMINHSCEPNAHYYAEGRTIRVRSLQPLKCGEEINVTYVPNESLMYGFEHRREQLLSNWNFWCECPQCAREQEEADIKSEETREKERKIAKAQSTLHTLTQKFRSQRKSDHNVARFKLDVERIQKGAFPGDEWPADLEPIADIEATFTDAEREAPDLREDFKMAMRYVFSTNGSRVGGSHTLSAVDALRIVVQELENSPWTDYSMPDLDQSLPIDMDAYMVLLEGYLLLLGRGVVFAYGADVYFAARCKRKLETWAKQWGMDHVKDDFDKDFWHSFEHYQSELLRWCKIPQDRRFQLPRATGCSPAERRSHPQQA